MPKKDDRNDVALIELMRKAQQGDKNAYSLMFQKITPILRSFVSKKLSKTEDVEDLVQEVLISIHQASHTYDTDRPFKAWMFAIARYRLSDHLRGVYKKREQGHDVNFDEISFELSNKENVTKDYENREYLSKLLDHLPKKQRRIVTMMKIEGYTAAETAKKLGMSETAVKVSAHRALKTLSHYAGKEG